jgi:hypothetical protein
MELAVCVKQTLPCQIANPAHVWMGFVINLMGIVLHVILVSQDQIVIVA